MTEGIALRQSSESFRRLRAAGEQEAVRERAAVAETASGLGATAHPHAPVYIFLGLIAVVLDVLDFFETPGDATVVLFFVQAIVEIGFFLLVKALVGRGVLTSWALMFVVVFGISLSVIPVVGAIPMGMTSLVVLMAAVMNRNVKVAQASGDRAVEQLRAMDRKLAVAEQRVQRMAARARAMGRRAGQAARSARVSARTARITRSVTKASRTTFRALRNTIANIIPFLEFLPFQLLTVIGTYRDQKRLFHESQARLAEYRQQLAALDEARAEELRLAAAMLADEATEPGIRRRAPAAQAAGTSEPPARAAPPMRDIERTDTAGPQPVRPRQLSARTSAASVPVRDIAFAS
jgi:hypothetical protein